jgi:hypothetical protein
MRSFRCFILLPLFIIVLCGCTNKIVTEINRTDVEGHENLRWEDDNSKLAFITNVSVTTRPYTLKKGKYSLLVRAYGTKGEKRLPVFSVGFASHTIQEITTRGETALHSLNFEIFQTTTGRFSFTFSDDFTGPKEDRNVYVYFPIKLRLY